MIVLAHARAFLLSRDIGVSEYEDCDKLNRAVIHDIEKNTTSVLLGQN